jgi:MEMO1 family protein
MDDATVREPVAAGTFYPAAAARLEATVRALLERAHPPRGARPIGLMVPHAGYVYSGLIAADGWRQTGGHDYDLVVVLAPNHTVARFAGFAVWPRGGFRTPLGTVPVDEAAAAALLAADPDADADPRPHRREHAIEVQLPFAQIALPGVPLLPVVVGSEDPQACARFGDALVSVLAGRRALVVASSDLSHYPAHDDALAADRAVLAAVARLDPDGLRRTILAEERAGRPGLSTCACGAAPLLVTLAAARALGATRGTVVAHATSGDVPGGDRERVVGYGAVAFTVGQSGADLAALDQPPHVPGAPRREEP